MRLLPILSGVFLTVATPVLAQVTVDLHALQALPERPAAGRPSRTAPTVAPRTPVAAAPRPPGQPAAPTVALTSPEAASPEAASPEAASPEAASRGVSRGTAPTTVSPGTTSPGAQPPLPEEVPNIASIAPVTPQAPSAAAQAPAPPVSDTAVTAAAPTATGIRLTFAPGVSDLSPESSSSIKQLTGAPGQGDSTTFNVLAYAPGKADDPSTARRISLSRAMAVRSALVADGIPSARIFVRALGDRYGDGPADRVDLSVTGASEQSGPTRTPVPPAPAAAR